MGNSFQDERRFLSNFWECSVTIAGMTFPSAEHAYQALKTMNRDEREAVRDCKTPGQAKRAGRQVTFRRDWNALRLDVMHAVVLKKFEQNEDLQILLIDTGDEELVENNVWHDNFWGNCTCEKCTKYFGFNFLGKILMSVRAAMRSNEENRKLATRLYVEVRDEQSRPRRRTKE